MIKFKPNRKPEPELKQVYTIRRNGSFTGWISNFEDSRPELERWFNNINVRMWYGEAAINAATTRSITSDGTTPVNIPIQIEGNGIFDLRDQVTLTNNPPNND